MKVTTFISIFSVPREGESERQPESKREGERGREEARGKPNLVDGPLLGTKSTTTINMQKKMEKNLSRVTD